MRLRSASAADEAFVVRPLTAMADLVTPSVSRRNYELDGDWDATTLAGRVAEYAAKTPDQIAVIDLLGARTKTYAELDQDANRVASYLSRMSIGPGDVVSVQLPNWYETVAIDIGVLRVGAVLNPLLTLYRTKELRYMLSAAATKIVFVPHEYNRFDHVTMVEQIHGDLPSLVEVVTVEDPERGTAFSDWLLQFPNHPALDAVAASAVSELIFTSGTEADPKAVMHTEQTTNFSVRTAWRSIGMQSTDVVWMPSPIGHGTGLNYGVRMALYHGLTLVLQDRWSADAAARLVARYRPSYAMAATTFLSDLVQRGAQGDCDLSSLRLFASGGASVPPELVQEAAKLGITVLRLYGSTESQGVTWNRPKTPEAKRIFTDGPALEHVEVDVRDDDGRSVRNEPGEIFARSAGTSVGLYADSVRTTAMFNSEGWVRLGDLGVLDDDGYLTVVGRKKEIIIRGGLNIAPREIEEMIMKLPEVTSVAVVGLPHPRLGEITCACVVLRQGASLEFSRVVEELKAAGLATYKLPQAVAIVDALPMTSTGKIRKHELVANLDRSALQLDDRSARG